MEKDLNVVLEAVSDSKKYKYLAPELVRYVAERELGKRKKLKEVIKNTKNKLHQVGAMYQEGTHYRAWLEELKGIRDNEEETRKLLSGILKSHASTRERLPVMEELFDSLFALLPPVRSILDLGCGLNPLALAPRLLKGHITCYACDIYTDLTDFIGEFFALMGIQGESGYVDILNSVPEWKTDVAFLLKMLPVIEQEKPGRSLSLLEDLPAPNLVISFPARSIGGRQKGMSEHYSSTFLKMIEGKNWEHHRLDFPSEILFVIKKHTSVQSVHST